MGEIDLINRAATVEAIQSLADTMSVCISMDECKGMRSMKGRAIRAINNLQPVQPEKAQLSEEDATKGTTFDCISRQAAIDALENQKDKNAKGDIGGFYNTIIQHDIDAIAELPSAQPEIIRCKDCKNWDTTWQNNHAPNYHYCPMIDGTCRNDFYCADAERITDG